MFEPSISISSMATPAPPREIVLVPPVGTPGTDALLELCVALRLAVVLHRQNVLPSEGELTECVRLPRSVVRSSVSASRRASLHAQARRRRDPCPPPPQAVPFLKPTGMTQMTKHDVGTLEDS